MRVAVAGGTGLLGRALIAALLEEGHAPAVLTRNPGRARRLFPSSVTLNPWSPSGPADLAAALEGTDAVINLAGENIGARRWTAARRRAILESRTRSAEALARAAIRCDRPPTVFLQASAAGYYGDRGEALLDEAGPPGTGFLAEVAREWEAAALPAAARGARLVFLRFGVVLAREGGALPRMALPFRLFLGGWPGNGRQYLSWIHRDDAVRALLFLLEHPEIEGPFNATAPQPVEARMFYRFLGRALGRPCWLRQPAWLLAPALGAMARELLLAGQRVLPRRLSASGFEFLHPDPEEALNDLLGGRPGDGRT